MNPADGSSRQAASALQRRFPLAELLDRQSVNEVCSSYAELFGVGLKIIDEAGQVLIDVKGSGNEFCAYLFTFARGKSECTRVVTEVRNLRVEQPPARVHGCFSGLRYLVEPIRHEGDTLGRLVLGPYRAAEGDEMTLPALGEKYDPQVAQRLWDQVRRVADDVVRKVSHHLVQTLEAMLYIGYKHKLTSNVHVEAVTASYNELQRKNQALQEAFDRLKELDRLKSNFLATVSHELRTPLTSVIGYSEMLLEGLAGQLNGEQGEYVTTIMEKGEQLLRIISSILDFSKMDMGTVRLERRECDLLEVVRSAVSTIMPLANKQQVKLALRVAPHLPPAWLDGDKITQVLVNIIGNAVKFNKAGGSVEVAVDMLSRQSPPEAENDLPAALAPQREEFFRVVVADSGVGIAPEQQERIFDSFYQVDGSSTREYGGTGLGLAIAKGLVDAHGGRIEVESEPGRGSRFTVLLPRRQHS